MARRTGGGGIILLAVIFGLVTAYLIYSYMRDQERKSVKNWEFVVVASADIKPRTKIARDMIQMEKYPKDLIPENAVRKIEEVENRTAQNPINAKAQIRTSDLVPAGVNAGLSLKVPDGMRGVAIGGDMVKFVGTGVQPGDRVDIIATYFDPRTKQDVTKTILQNVLVLAVDENRQDAGGGPGAKSSMTLAVRPDQVELVKAAERSGTMSVSLRSINDKEFVATPGFNARSLAGAAEEGPVSAVESNESRSTPVIFLNTQQVPHQPSESEITVIRSTAETKVLVNK